MDDSNFEMPPKREEGGSEGMSAPIIAFISGAGFLAGIFSTFIVARCRSSRSNEGPTPLAGAAAVADTPITNPATPMKFTTIPAGTAAGTVADKV